MGIYFFVVNGLAVTFLSFFSFNNLFTGTSGVSVPLLLFIFWFLKEKLNVAFGMDIFFGLLVFKLSVNNEVWDSRLAK